MGVFQYGLSIVEGLINFCPDFNYTIFYFGEGSPKEFLKVKSFENVNFVSLDAGLNNRLGKLKVLINALLQEPFFVINKKNKDILKTSKVDLLIIPLPLLFGFENKVPYIVSIPDIMHRYYPGFPEYKLWDRIKRDIVYSCSAKKSILSVVDSKQGIYDLHKFYNIPEQKIKAIPYIPPGYIYEYKNMDNTTRDRLISKYNLPEKFIFYPAQFWFHKNHLRLVKALRIIKEEKHSDIPLVLAGNPGANNENYKKVMDLVKEAKMENQVMPLGYVSDEEMVALYKKSLALVFPTLIGPTSIPPLEAIVLGVPVLCSNLFAMPEEVGDAGVLFDPFSEKDMAEKIYKVWTSENLRKNLTENAKKMAEKITSERFTNEWKSAINEALYGKRS